MGYGCDRHLYCLYKLAENEGGDIPSIFTNEAFQVLMTDTMCTTNLNVPFVEAMMVNPAFSDFANEADKEGSVVLEKYMTPYSTFANEIKFIVCSFEPANVEEFKNAVIASIDDIRDIIVGDDKEEASSKEAVLPIQTSP